MGELLPTYIVISFGIAPKMDWQTIGTKFSLQFTLLRYQNFTNTSSKGVLYGLKWFIDH